MAAYWKKTKLSVSQTAFEMADTDRIAFSFDAKESIESVVAQLWELPNLVDASAQIEEATVNVDALGVTVIVEGLVRGKTYELSVTFVRADETTWTRTLALDCVA